MGSWSPPFLDALNRLAGVLIYDRRGYGQSAPLPPRQSLPKRRLATSTSCCRRWTSARPWSWSGILWAASTPSILPASAAMAYLPAKEIGIAVTATLVPMAQPRYGPPTPCS
jgi:hypothetical protein